MTAGLHHLGLAVANLSETTDFFIRGLGWSLVREERTYPANFVSDGAFLITLWQTDPDRQAFDRRKHVGLHHLALRARSQDELSAIYQRAASYPEVHIEFAPEPLRGGPAVHCMLREPGGIRVEIIWWPDAATPATGSSPAR